MIRRLVDELQPQEVIQYPYPRSRSRTAGQYLPHLNPLESIGRFHYMAHEINRGVSQNAGYFRH